MEQRRSSDQEKLQQQQQPPRRGKAPETHMAGQNQNQNQNPHHHHQPPPPQKCPRCESSNTKFCYYNNYSLSQPRYFCKACRRYWTQGGTLRNVPVGGGCRKSKRPKHSVASSSAGEIARAQSNSSPAIGSQNLMAGMMISGGQGVRALPPPQVMLPSMAGNSFYTGGGGFLSSLAAMQSFNQGAAVNLGGGGGQYDTNMALLRGVNLSSMRPPAAAPQHFPAAQNEFYQSQQNMTIPPRPSALSSWTQGFINRGVASSSAASPNFWGGATADGGENQAGSSFNPNNWPDNHQPGFDPPQ